MSDDMKLSGIANGVEIPSDEVQKMIAAAREKKPNVKRIYMGGNLKENSIDFVVRIRRSESSLDDMDEVVVHRVPIAPDKFNVDHSGNYNGFPYCISVNICERLMAKYPGESMQFGFVACDENDISCPRGV